MYWLWILSVAAALYLQVYRAYIEPDFYVLFTTVVPYVHDLGLRRPPVVVLYRSPLGIKTKNDDA